jgi:hypothetical protein
MSRTFFVVIGVACLLVFQTPGLPQSQQTSQIITTQQDLQAITVLRQSLAAMGGLPNSIAATGTVTLTEGSTTKSGSIRIETSDSKYTLENWSFSDEERTIVYAQGLASVRKGGVLKKLNGATSLTSQSAIFVAPILAELLNDPNVSVKSLGAESIETAQAYHFVFLNTFNSAPDLKDFSKLTQRDLWINSSSGLPLRLSYTLSTGAGPADTSTPVVVDYSDFASNGGIAVPQNINVSLNGTQWLSISITSVSINSGVSVSDFQIN